ncbi:MAG: Methyltransferase type 11 [Nonomuraea muscovyensis]|nr:Methyltransferase type 11 [Nonomuraea muscovyensis]
MPDAIFAHPRLARVYDAFDADREDLTAYLDIADELGADQVLDVGCGTGCLAVLLAGSGRAVVGVDPAAASLEVAKSKDRTGGVTWVQGDATTVPALGADLALMTGNVAQVFLTDHDWIRTLRGIHAALRPRGHLVFETRRPEHRAWEEWAADTSRVILDIPGSGPVEQRREVTDVSLPFVSFRYTYRFLSDGAVVTSDSTLRFRSRDEVESDLLAHGYRVLDVREAPDRPGREFVFISERMASPPLDGRRSGTVLPDRWLRRCGRTGAESAAEAPEPQESRDGEGPASHLR